MLRQAVEEELLLLGAKGEGSMVSRNVRNYLSADTT
jgi:hypothetical protein